MLKKYPYVIYVPAIVWALFILVGCLISPKFIPHPSWSFIGLDKLVHFTLYFVQCAFLVLVFWQKGMHAYKNAWVSFMLCVGYGILVEFMQMQMRLGREADIDDALANVVGAGTFSLLLVVFYRFLKR